MEVFKKEGYRVPVKSWCPDIEENAMEQIDHLAQLPFVIHHVAIMGDCHSGYGMPIGGVIATKGVVIPNAVGVDIGCGMCAINTYLKREEISVEQLKTIMGMIREAIPVGFNHHKEAQHCKYMPNSDFDGAECNWMPTIGYRVIHPQYQSALHQIGTLGGGNHFIEIQTDEEDNVWIMIHSGSRNLGKKVCDHYNKIAKEINSLWFSCIDSKWDLAFLPIETDEAKDYLREMNYCVEFAYANRLHMMNAVKNIFVDIMKSIEFSDVINIAHNYAAWENHFGQNVIVHRKGATRAREGELGIIPGSMGTASYIVEGLGNVESFNSCSHGAGRKMGRNEAKKRLDLSAEIANLDARGIIHGVRNQSDLDEAPGAYKDVDEVMANQADLVKPIVKLRPLASIKG